MHDTDAPTTEQPSPEPVFDRLTELGIPFETVTHPPVFTVEEAKRLRGELPGGHCKSLFLRDKKKRTWLVVALEDTPIDLRQLAGQLGANRLSFGSAARLWEMLGVIPGSVTPFALLNDPERAVTPVLDVRMMRETLVHYHPLRNDMTTALSPPDLDRFIRSTGHQRLLLDVAAGSAD